jgi:Transposase DDE domain
VRSWWDWKYLLAVPVDDAGFDASVLSEFRARLQAQATETSSAFRERYRRRTGVEGTFSVAVRTAGARRARTRGLAKVRLEHLLIAASLNLGRLATWFQGGRPATTQQRPFHRLMAVPAFP